MDKNSNPGWVTVIVPTYNRARFLTAALDSVSEQTYRPVELIVVDDGSTDDTEARIRQWAQEHQTESFRVRYLFQSNAGPSAARNLGLIRSSGEYIQFLDSDDRLHPQKLAVHVHALEVAPTCDAIVGKHKEFAPQKEPNFDSHEKDRLVKGATRKQLEELTLLGGNLWSGLYRRELCVQAGPINESLWWMEDVEYNIRMSAVATAVRRVELPLLAYCCHDSDQLTETADEETGVRSGLASVTAMEETLKGLSAPLNASVRHTVANFYMGIAQLAMKMRRPEAVEECLAGALRNQQDPLFRAKVWGLHAARRVIGDEQTWALWTWATGMDD
jgi:GT2 family glycosyltransferase